VKAAATILLFEGDADIHALLAETLADEGYTVRSCRSVAEVQQVANESLVALALVDAWGDNPAILGDDERTTIEELARAVPTVMVTGRAWAQRFNPANLGLVALVPKPFDLDELLALLKQTVEDLLRERADACDHTRLGRAQTQDASVRPGIHPGRAGQGLGDAAWES
jgi:DNA-binding NtrC family response regulator